MSKWHWSGVVESHSSYVTIGGRDPVEELTSGGDGFFSTGRAYVVLRRGPAGHITRYDELYASQQTWLTETTPDISEAFYTGPDQGRTLDLLEMLRFCDGMHVDLSISAAEEPT